MADVYLMDVIDSWWGVDPEKFIREIHATEDDTIRLHVNSPGGNVFDGIAIMTALREHPARVEARVLGLAASIASVIVAGAADSVAITRGAQFMIHNPISVIWGDAAAMRREAKLLDSIKDDLVDVYMRRMSGDSGEIAKIMDAETWYGADEALDVGLADELIGGEPRNVSKFEAILKNYKNTPANFANARQKTTLNLSELERTLRDAGLTRTQAKAFISEGKSGLRDAGGGMSQRDVGLQELSETLRRLS